MASNETRERERRIKWNEAANSDILECRKQAQLLVNSENPPRFDNGRKKGYMRIMKGLWEERWLPESLGAEFKGPSRKTGKNARERRTENKRKCWNKCRRPGFANGRK